MHVLDQWTGIIDIEKTQLSQIKMRYLSTDIMMLRKLPYQCKRWSTRLWKPLFNPKEWISCNGKVSTSEFVLGKAELKLLGEEVTRARKQM